nr:hypothetical protein [uncultured Halomonas sp.]
MLLLALLGTALGFTTVNPQAESNPLAGIPIATAIYTAIAYIIALAIGGYAAARLTSSAWKSAAILHGAAVWALAALLTVAAAVNGVGAAISGTASLVSTVSGSAAKAVQAVVPNNVELPDLRNLETLIPDDFMQSLPPEIQQSLQQKNVTLEDIQREGRQIIRQVISQQEQQRAKQAVTDTAASIIRNPGQAQQQIEQLIDQLFGQNGLFSQQDRQQAVQLMQNRLGISPEEAEAIIDQVQAALDEAAQTVENTLNDIQKQAAQLAGQIADAIAAAAWAAFIIFVLGLLAAIGGAMLGRPKHLHH